MVSSRWFVQLATTASAVGFMTVIFAPGCGDFDGYHLANTKDETPGGKPVDVEGGSGGAKPVDDFAPPVAPSADGKCASARKLCDGQCVSRSDPAYGCSDACAACNVPRGTAGCSEGRCVVRSCDEGRGDCNGLAADGCEAGLTSELTNCGKCANACRDGAVCSNSSCATTCADGLSACRGTCVNFKSDDSNCNGCGVACTGFNRCVNGACACTPSCVGKACGTSDGCGGTCDGTCSPGLRCSNKMCVCDAQSACAGCCQGGACLTGESNAACGKGGGACLACGGTSTCRSSGACASPQPSIVCASGMKFVGLSVSCSSVCATQGRSCRTGCFALSDVVGSSTIHDCNVTVTGTNVRDCAKLTAVDDEFSLICCCS